MHTITPNQDTIRDAFTTSDCWALTTALCHHYPHLRPHVLGGSDGGWVHALAYEPSTGLYVDVDGAHTFEEVQTAWENHPEWDEMREATAADFAGLTRRAPHVSTDAGIAAALAAGWTPRLTPPQDAATASSDQGRGRVYEYAVRVTEIATETLTLSAADAAASFADPEHPTAEEIEAARAKVTEAGRDLPRKWHDVESERVSPDLIEVTTA